MTDAEADQWIQEHVETTDYCDPDYAPPTRGELKEAGPSPDQQLRFWRAERAARNAADCED